MRLNIQWGIQVGTCKCQQQYLMGSGLGMSLKLSRDTILFGVGLLGIIFEAISFTITGRAEPTLIILFAGMLGLPLFISGDERHKSNGSAK